MTPAPRSSPAGCACRIRAWSSRSRSSATPAVRSGRPFRARLPLSLVSDQIHELGEQAVGRWGRYVWIALGATALALVAALYLPLPPDLFGGGVQGAMVLPSPCRCSSSSPAPAVPTRGWSTARCPRPPSPSRRAPSSVVDEQHPRSHRVARTVLHAVALVALVVAFLLKSLAYPLSLAAMSAQVLTLVVLSFERLTLRESFRFTPSKVFLTEVPSSATISISL